MNTYVDRIFDVVERVSVSEFQGGLHVPDFQAPETRDPRTTLSKIQSLSSINHGKIESCRPGKEAASKQKGHQEGNCLLRMRQR